MLFRRHWTPRYFWDRVARAVYERSHPGHPWLTRQAVAVLSDWLEDGDRGLEWGSGRSTVWLASRVVQLMSIEHNPEWYEKVHSILEEKGLRNVDYRKAEVDPASSSSPEHPYVSAAAELTEGSLDFVLVDGVMRDHCTTLATRLLKPGGLLVLDNVERYFPHDSRSPESIGPDGQPPTELWREVLEELQAWRRIWTCDGIADTAFYVKPPA